MKRVPSYAIELRYENGAVVSMILDGEARTLARLSREIRDPLFKDAIIVRGQTVLGPLRRLWARTQSKGARA